ncbi:hypothetical protein AFEL58S_00574 [Afipia felis]
MAQGDRPLMRRRRAWVGLAAMVAAAAPGSVAAQAMPLAVSMATVSLGGMAHGPAAIERVADMASQPRRPPRRYDTQIGQIFREEQPVRNDNARLAEGALRMVIIDPRRAAFYRQNHFYGGTPYYGRQFYGGPAYYPE